MMIIGIGNEFRRDDAVGLIAARRIRERGAPAEEHSGDAALLMDRWKLADGVILIDAVAPSGSPGAIHCVDAAVHPPRREFCTGSTHALDVADAIELARAMGRLPPRLYIIGIEAADVSPGLGLSFEVENALPIVVERVLAIAAETR